jgi:hypothetical protein
MSRSKQKLKRTQKRKVNKTLKKNVRKSMNRKVVKRYSKKTIKRNNRQKGSGIWDTLRYGVNKIWDPHGNIVKSVEKKQADISDLYQEALKAKAAEAAEAQRQQQLTTALATEAGLDRAKAGILNVNRSEDQPATQLGKTIAAREASNLCPLIFMYTHSGRIMCILYSLLSGNKSEIEKLSKHKKYGDEQGKFYNNCVVELLFEKKDGDQYHLTAKLVVSGNIDGKGGKRLCSSEDSVNNSSCQYLNLEPSLQVIEENIPEVILERLSSCKNLGDKKRIFLIRHGQAEHNVMVLSRWKHSKLQHGGVGDAGYMQDSDLTPEGIKPVESAAEQLYSYLTKLGYNYEKFIEKFEVTCVSMLKRTFHTAALVNGVLLLHYYGLLGSRGGTNSTKFRSTYIEERLRYFPKFIEDKGKLTKLTTFKIKQDLGEIESGQVKEATFKIKEKWGNSGIKYNDTGCAGTGHSRSKIITTPEKIPAGTFDIHQANTPCSTYAEVTTVRLEFVSPGQTIKRKNQNKCEDHTGKRPIKMIYQYTSKQKLDLFEFELSRDTDTPDRRAHIASHPPIAMRIGPWGGSKRKLKKSKKRKTKNIRK